MSFSVVGATLPTTRRFVLDLMTYYNHGAFESTMSGSHSATHRSEAYAMSRLKASSASASRNKARTNGMYAEPDVDVVGENSSQEMIIRKDVRFEVQSEPGALPPDWISRV